MMSKLKLRFAHGLVLAVVFPFVQSEATSFDAQPGPEADVRNVILLTWDGVRRQEFFDGADETLAEGDLADTFPWFRENLKEKGANYGDERTGARMTVGNTVMMSLPGYQAIFAGRPQNCFDNYCGRIGQSTLGERLVQSLGLDREKVAHLASWHAIKFAAERKKGSIFVNAGLENLADGTVDSVQDELNAGQLEHRPPWPAARYDSYTVKHAMHYLEKHRPRFLHIGLNDSDEWAHRGDYKNYLSSLRQYDQWLKELVEKLGTMGDYGRNTCLVITTDHGRGSGPLWTKHSNGVLESGLVWMHASCPFMDGEVAFAERSFLTTHLDIKPTIEDMMGLRPRPCVGCGASLYQR